MISKNIYKKNITNIIKFNNKFLTFIFFGGDFYILYFINIVKNVVIKFLVFCGL